MTVRSHDLADRPQGSALVSRRTLARQQPALERLAAVGLLLISFIGSALFGGGGAHAWLARDPFWVGCLAALAGQGALTAVQWVYCARGWHSSAYNAAVIASSALSLAGFWPVLYPWGVGQLTSWQVPASTAPWVAGAALIGAALLIDIFPERMLTR